MAPCGAENYTCNLFAIIATVTRYGENNSTILNTTLCFRFTIHAPNYLTDISIMKYFLESATIKILALHPFCQTLL